MGEIDRPQSRRPDTVLLGAHMCLTAPLHRLSPRRVGTGGAPHALRLQPKDQRCADKPFVSKPAATSRHRRCAQLRRRACRPPVSTVHASPRFRSENLHTEKSSIRTHTPRARDPKGRASRRLRSPHQAMPRLRVPRQPVPPPLSQDRESTSLQDSRKRLSESDEAPACANESAVSDLGGTGGTAVGRGGVGLCLHRGLSGPARDVTNPDRVERHEANEPQSVSAG